MTAPHGEAPGAHRVRLVVRADPPSGGPSDVPGLRDVEPGDLRDPDAEIFGWTCVCGSGSAFLQPLWRARQMAADHQETMERLALRGELVAGAVPSVLPEGRRELQELNIPTFIFPESAARAVQAMCRYREWRERPEPTGEPLLVDRAAGEALLRRALAAGRTRLDELESLRLLAAYGIPTAAAELATDKAAAAAAAARIGFPVVLKIVAPAIVHKTEVGGVEVGLDSAAEAEAAYERIIAGARKAYPDAAISGVLVQKMVAGGRELIVGMSRDPSVGPLLMFGLGGVLVEVLGDVVFRLAPINRLEASDMLKSIRGVRLLQGVRGAPPADLRALEDILIRAGRLAADFPAIAELDLNPVLAFGDGAVAVDARVMLAAPA